MEQTIEIERIYGKPSIIAIGEVLGKLDEYLPQRRVIVITDSNVHRRYQQIIDRYEHIIIGLGETNKTLVTVDKIYHELLEMDVDRECFILGFGGGIVTDIAGFVASTYMRGLRFGFVASTLLAQVDASIGGKNGVNVNGYKNMAGTFNQPEFVLCDTTLLNTLAEREFRAGLAEVIKAGVVADHELFELFEHHTFDEFKENKSLLGEAITRAVKVKVEIVRNDQTEQGERRKLNLGHTFAHALEKSSTIYLHGEAVAIGLSIISELAVEMGVLAGGEQERINNVLSRMGFELRSKVDDKQLIKALGHDKKRDSDHIYIVLPTTIGACDVRRMELAEVEKYLENVISLQQDDLKE